MSSSDQWWRQLAGRGTERVSAGRAWFDSLLERHRHRLPVDVGARIYERDRESAGSVVSSAVAFRLFQFFVPLLLFAVGLVGFLGAELDSTEAADAGVGGSIGRQIDSALDQQHGTKWIAIGLGLIGMVTAGRTLTKTLSSASCLSWRLPVRSKSSAKVTGGLVGLIVGVSLVAVGVNRARDSLGIAGAGMSLLVAFGVYTLAWLLVGALLPRSSSDPGTVLPGAALVAGVLVGMQAVSQLYLPGQFSKASELYGAIGTTVVVLGWFFIIARAMVLSMTVNAVLYERFGSITQLIFALPVLRAFPARSPRVRRFFDLVDDGPVEATAGDRPSGT